MEGWRSGRVKGEEYCGRSEGVEEWISGGLKE